jgi:hypothetical protein
MIPSLACHGRSLNHVHAARGVSATSDSILIGSRLPFTTAASDLQVIEAEEDARRVRLNQSPPATIHQKYFRVVEGSIMIGPSPGRAMYTTIIATQLSHFCAARALFALIGT